jgi:subtilisin family serine protease
MSVRRPVIIAFITIFLMTTLTFDRLTAVFGQVHDREGQTASGQSEKVSRALVREIASRPSTRGPLPVWVFFKDKGLFSPAEIEAELDKIRRTLSEHCRWRRLKVRSEAELVDIADIPVCPEYVKALTPFIRKIRATSNWLNAVSVEAGLDQVRGLESLPFIQSLDLVKAFKRHDPRPAPALSSYLAEEPLTPFELDYGSSFAQLNQINVLPLHQLGWSGSGVIVCMMDSGFRKTHEVFKQARLIAERDFVNGDDDVQQNLTDPNDYSDSHGTGTWSILGGYKPGELIGPAYGASFILAKTETDNFEKPIEEDYWAAGIGWAESLGAEVVSSSLGYTDWYTFKDMDGKTAVTTKAANRAVSLGVVVVNAAGNERGKAWGHIIAPADGFEVIAAGAVTLSGSIASFSSPGPTFDGRIKPEVCALGVNNWLAANRSNGSDYYASGSGTSFATPLVGGAAALLLEIHRDWTPAQVRAALMDTAGNSGSPNNDYGWGIVNATAAAGLSLAVPKLSSFTVDDDSVGRSSGNSNGQAEPGETVEIALTLKNDSAAPASSLQTSLRAAQPGFQVILGKVTIPLLPGNGTAQPGEKLAVRIPDSYIGHRAVFWLRVEGAGCLPLDDGLVVAVKR